MAATQNSACGGAGRVGCVPQGVLLFRCEARLGVQKRALKASQSLSIVPAALYVLDPLPDTRIQQ